jgi:hypothetical protein
VQCSAVLTQYTNICRILFADKKLLPQFTILLFSVDHHLYTFEYYFNFRIHTIEGYAFAGTEHISMLVINDNPIKIVDSFAFAGLKHVKFLLLSSSVKHLHTVSGHFLW